MQKMRLCSHAFIICLFFLFFNLALFTFPLACLSVPFENLGFDLLAQCQVVRCVASISQELFGAFSRALASLFGLFQAQLGCNVGKWVIVGVVGDAKGFVFGNHSVVLICRKLTVGLHTMPWDIVHEVVDRIDARINPWDISTRVEGRIERLPAIIATGPIPARILLGRRVSHTVSNKVFHGHSFIEQAWRELKRALFIDHVGIGTAT